VIPGICKLCLEVKMLCDSHLAPAGLYRYCKAKDLGPVRMTATEITATNIEVTAPLLCQECEDRLNRDGENWLLPKLATIDQKFPFYDLVVAVPPDTAGEDFAAYACSRNEKIGFRKLTNFAVGVFWKASVHSWEEGKTTPMIQLGKYEERLRLFLMRKAQFPEKASLTIGVTPPANAVIGFNMPVLRAKRPWHMYLLHVPGIVFILSVGNEITRDQRENCFFSNPLHPIIVANFSQDILKLVGRETKNAARSQELKDYRNTKTKP